MNEINWDDKEEIIAVVKQGFVNWAGMEKMNKNLLNDYEVVIEIMKEDPHYIQLIGNELLNDIEFVKEYFIVAKKALIKNSDHSTCINEFLEYINDEIKNNQEFGIWYYDNIVKNNQEFEIWYYNYIER